MKRSGPIKRKSGLMASTDAKRSPLKRSGAQKARPSSKDAAWRQCQVFVKDRSQGRCEGRLEGVCTGRGEHVHHVILRSRGGPDEPWNCVHLCRACHDWAHANPTAATERGLMKSMPATG